MSSELGRLQSQLSQEAATQEGTIIIIRTLVPGVQSDHYITGHRQSMLPITEVLY